MHIGNLEDFEASGGWKTQWRWADKLAEEEEEDGEDVQERFLDSEGVKRIHGDLSELDKSSSAK